MAEATQYGAVFTDNHNSTYEDLVGPTYYQLDAATDAVMEGRTAGRRGVVVFRESEGDPWLTIFSRQTPAAWIRAHR